MKLFLFAFAFLTLGSLVLLYTDGPESGMQYVAGFFGLVGGGTLLYNKIKNGGWLNDATKR